jgi:hypothetical protein
MIPHLSQQTRRDMKALGLSTDDLKRYLVMLDSATFTFLAVDDDEPFAAFGVSFTDFNECETFMICTESCFEKHGRWVTVQIIKALKSDHKDLFPELTINLYSANEESAAKWFKTIGFCKDNDYTDKNIARFVYRR